MDEKHPPSSPICPGCRMHVDVDVVTLPPTPMTLNYVYKDRQKAQAAPAAPVILRQCKTCGLVYVAPNSAQAVYDERYENRQSFSDVFTEHLEHVAETLKILLPKPKVHVLEIGCGKGDFLELLARRYQWRGHGYDTSYAGPKISADGKLKFSREYLTHSSVQDTFDVLVCRHVIEHIETIGEFLEELWKTSRQAGVPLVMLETPRLEWIFEHNAIWDFFHEHRCYFGMNTLKQLCQAAGFDVLEHASTFGGQYQNLYLRPVDNVQAISHVYDHSLSITDFTTRASEHFRELAKSMDSYLRGEAWAIWGAGAKGVCWAGWLSHWGYPLRGRVVDRNPSKQEGFLPLTGLPIVAPTKRNLQDVELVFVMNPNYYSEIQSQLISLDLSPKIMTI